MGFRIVIIGLLHFLEAGGCNRHTKPGLFILLAGAGFFCLSSVFYGARSVLFLFFIVRTIAIDYLEILVSKMNVCLSSGTLVSPIVLLLVMSC